MAQTELLLTHGYLNSVNEELKPNVKKAFAGIQKLFKSFYKADGMDYSELDHEDFQTAFDKRNLVKFKPEDAKQYLVESKRELDKHCETLLNTRAVLTKHGNSYDLKKKANAKLVKSTIESIKACFPA